MRIMVTGGAGFIGSNVVDAYIDAGHQLVVIDNLSTGHEYNLNPEARFIQSDVQNIELQNIFEEFKPEVVNHHAAHIDLRRSVQDPMLDAQSNILGTLNLLKLANEHGVKKFIFSSTGGAIYGEPDELPASEATNPVPLSPYGAGKLACEHYIRIWGHLFGINYTIFRYPNVFGPRQHPKGEAGVVAIFSLQILQGQNPKIFGDGTKTRDYLYVADVVKANLLALESSSNAVMNLGWGREVSDRLVFDTISSALDYKLDPEYVSVRPGEVKRISLDSKLAREVLDWEPDVTFEEGITKAVQFYCETEEKY